MDRTNFGPTSKAMAAQPLMCHRYADCKVTTAGETKLLVASAITYSSTLRPMPRTWEEFRGTRTTLVNIDAYASSFSWGGIPRPAQSSATRKPPQQQAVRSSSFRNNSSSNSSSSNQLPLHRFRCHIRLRRPRTKMTCT